MLGLAGKKEEYDSPGWYSHSVKQSRRQVKCAYGATSEFLPKAISSSRCSPEWCVELWELASVLRGISPRGIESAMQISQFDYDELRETGGEIIWSWDS